ncbi:MAG: hypothetical protein ABSE54_07780 [Smithella sp.]|jgi:hypothetical protein
MSSGKKAINKLKRLPPFVPLPWDMLNHKAYKELPPSAAKALPYFIGKVKKAFHDPSRLNTEFSFSYKEAKSFGFALATFSKIIRDLVKHGFLDPIDKGGLRGDCKSNNLFCLSHRWKLLGQPDFQFIDWKCFLPRQKQLQKVKRTTSIYEKDVVNL